MVLIRPSLLILLLALSFNSVARDRWVFKFATLIPPDTAWMKEIDRWAAEVARESQGRLKFKIYPGGIMGDEPDVLRKIRSRQLQGAFFTGYGIGHIYSPARVLEMPFLFKNTDESDYVRDRLMPEIERGFRKHGFELLGWPELGFIHFFSKYPIRSLAELKTRHIWLWQGDPMGEAFVKVAGVAPIPLSIMDVYMQLSAKHGSIDTVYNSPFGALALQWYTKLKYATNISMTNGIGSLVVSNRFFNSLPPDLQALLKRTGKITGQHITAIERRDNQESIAQLKQSGIKFMWDWNEKEFKELLSLRDQAAKIMADSGYIPHEYFARTRKMLEAFRARKAASGTP
ncbi:TRAP-type C4-dicarboxylate transport system, periplasmic component [hydrothermal vent metagenome]|uniref:TRAP-type C4-dicarboxylate transport system, periplasmic component n=1 Tax=hydrothermal vent metagenome TaxID=652676 RepID=A0A3B1C6G2_9ZZZZ